MQLANFALKMVSVIEDFNKETFGNTFSLRIGIHEGVLLCCVKKYEKHY